MDVLRSIFCCSPSLNHVCDEEYAHGSRGHHPFNKASAFVTSPFYDMWSSSLEDDSPAIIIPVDEEEYESMRECKTGFNETVLALSMASGFNVLDVPTVVDICTGDSDEGFSRGFALVSWRHSDDVFDIRDFRKIMALKHRY